MNTQELIIKQRNYEDLKEVLERVVQSFSSTTFNNDMINAKRSLSSECFINDEDLYAVKLESISSTINYNVDKLKELIVLVDEKIEDIKRTILSGI